MFYRVGRCGNHRAVCEPQPGIWKKESAFQWFLNFCAVKISVSRRLSRADLPSHYPICSVNQIKRACWTFRAKSPSHHSSQWKMLKKGKELMWGGGWDGWGEGKLLELWFRGFPWAVDSSSRSLQCLVCTPSTANCGDFEDTDTIRGAVSTNMCNTIPAANEHHRVLIYC